MTDRRGRVDPRPESICGVTTGVGGISCGLDGARRDRSDGADRSPSRSSFRDTAIIAERIVKRSAVEPEILRLGLAHRVQQLEAGDIGVALGGHQRDLRVQQLLLGIEDVEDGAGADALLGAGAFERELVGLDRDVCDWIAFCAAS